MAGCLVRVIAGELHIARERVAGPGYVLFVDAATNGNGWTYYPQRLDKDDFVLPWREPRHGEGYALGELVFRGGKIWRSLIRENVWEPGVSGWRDVSDVSDIPQWIQPTRPRETYQSGSVVRYQTKVWRSTIDDNASVPGTNTDWREAVRQPPNGG